MESGMVEWLSRYAPDLPSGAKKERYAELFYDAKQASIARVARSIRYINNLHHGETKSSRNWLRDTVKINSKDDQIYIYNTILRNVPLDQVVPVRSAIFASERTFRRAFISFGSEVRLMHSKGSFSICRICIVAAELLRSREKRFTTLNRDIILKWRRLHLEQQATERKHLDRRRAEASQLGLNGQPIVALIYPGVCVHI
jgi:hypothetical protein